MKGAGFVALPWRCPNGPSIGERAFSLRPAWLQSATTRQDLFIVLVMVALAVFSPLVGAALAAWVAYDRGRAGDTTLRNVALGLLVVAIAFLFVPDLRFGILSALA